MPNRVDKITWAGKVIGIQPRIRLLRSFDQRHHGYLGYILRVEGNIGASNGFFTLGIGKGAQEKHEFRLGDVVTGLCLPVTKPEAEPAEYYEVSKIRILERGPAASQDPPPWTGVPPALEVYRGRGHRRLAPNTYDESCLVCIWGCKMAVEMIIDQWKPNQKRYRQETFCYGPKSCRLYQSGPIRTVPGRKGMTWAEEDWVDKEATSNRGEDD